MTRCMTPHSVGRKLSTVQLWTDDAAKEFAIRLSTDELGIFRAASNLSSNYSYMAFEIEIGKMNTNGWSFMLEFLSDEWLVKARESPASLQGPAYDKKTNDERSPRNSHDHLISRTSSDRGSAILARVKRAGEKRIRPHLECHFCRLRYFDEDERTAHEKMWHAAKLENALAKPKISNCESIASSTS